MIYYCDTEFTSFNGDLLSIALVPEDVNKPSLYVELEYDATKLDPWVRANVVPHLEGNPVSKKVAAQQVQSYFISLREPNGSIEVVADWPEDLAHFYNVLITEPGTMVGVDNIQARLKRTLGWGTAQASKVPHHALYDAIALRDYWNARV